MEKHYLIVFADSSNIIFNNKGSIEKENFQLGSRCFEVDSSITVSGLCEFQVIQFDMNRIRESMKNKIKQIW